jgi:hypothetical protein
MSADLRVHVAPNGGQDVLKAAVADVSTPGSATRRGPARHAGAETLRTVRFLPARLAW